MPGNAVGKWVQQVRSTLHPATGHTTQFPVIPYAEAITQLHILQYSLTVSMLCTPMWHYG